MSYPILEAWFSVSIRRNRKSFMFAILALYATCLACIWLWSQFAETREGRSTGAFLFLVPTVLCSYLLTAQRLRDLNVSGGFALLWIPLNVLEGQIGLAVGLTAVIVLCAIPGTTGPNKFGEDPIRPAASAEPFL